MTNAIHNDKFSSPQTHTGQKHDGVRSGRPGESNTGFQSSAATRERPEAEVDRASMLLAQQTTDPNLSSSIRDTNQASEIAGSARRPFRREFCFSGGDARRTTDLNSFSLLLGTRRVIVSRP